MHAALLAAKADAGRYAAVKRARLLSPADHDVYAFGAMCAGVFAGGKARQRERARSPSPREHVPSLPLPLALRGTVGPLSLTTGRAPPPAASQRGVDEPSGARGPTRARVLAQATFPPESMRVSMPVPIVLPITEFTRYDAQS